MGNPEIQRVLVAEDEYLIGYLLAHELRRLGVEVLGPYENTNEVLRAAREKRPDAAILDINLRDGEVFPAADLLLAHKVPVVFHSACDLDICVAEMYPSQAVCTKPATVEELMQALEKQHPMRGNTAT